MMARHPFPCRRCVPVTVTQRFTESLAVFAVGTILTLASLVVAGLI